VAAPAVHLDTSFLIRALRAGSAADATLRRLIGDGNRLAMSSVAWAEFLCGPAGDDILGAATRLITERVPFDERDAETAASLFNETGRRRGSLVDCMIAATALRRHAALATSNLDDFRRFEASGLRLV
jgi:predicted nucleic acid-binding protein